jgi:hypothetical protein
MKWTENQSFMGWTCSECGWLFKPLGASAGASLNEMTLAFISQRDQEFIAHACAEHPKAKKA